MIARKKLNSHKRLLTWLSQIYWMTPTREVLSSFDPLLFEAVDLDHEETIAICNFIENLDNTTVKKVAIDYTNLFCGFRSNAPFPYESIYRGEQRMLMQAPFGEVKKVYSSNGYTPNQDISNEPEDHIAFEFEYLSFLLDSIGEALENNKTSKATSLIQKKNSFMEEHVQLWVPLFCDEVREQSDTEFFKLMSSLTKQAIVSTSKL